MKVFVNPLQRASFILVTFSMLSACVIRQENTLPTTAVYPGLESQPCWLERPVNGESIGQFGLARDIYIGGETPKTKSRKRAVNSLADYMALDTNINHILNDIDDDTLSIELKGRTLHFVNDFSIDGYVYSYAMLDNALTAASQQCAAKVCDLAACDPSWLCTPSKNEQIAMLGVSYLATSPVEQHYKSIENALLQAEYMYGVKVESSKDLRQVDSQYIRYNILRQQNYVSTGERERLSYAVTDRCYSESTLFSRVALYGNVSHSKIKPIVDIQWLTNPKYLGYDGAIGAVQRPVASGLLSDQIKLAIKRAAIELAFEKESNVSEELVVVQYKSGNSLLIRYINEETNVELKAKVLSIHFKEGEDHTLEVFAWLARLD
ncbi:MAG: hypothetical protein KUG82_06275 [Pseudomonadales bacterium]|nr:hypothetical protein [Pseudomonadales bacterium]